MGDELPHIWDYNELLAECRRPDIDVEDVCKRIDALVNQNRLSLEQSAYLTDVLIRRKRSWPKKG